MTEPDADKSFIRSLFGKPPEIEDVDPDDPDADMRHLTRSLFATTTDDEGMIR